MNARIAKAPLTEPVQRRREGRAAKGRAPDTGAVEKVIESPGAPLDGATSRFFGARFGFDFGQVRVHADAEAAVSADARNARAYTVGQHIVFNRSQYRPRTAEGIELIAHELAHTVQQRAATAQAVDPEAQVDPGLEQDARVAAGSALLGIPVNLRQTAAPSVQCAEFGTYVSTVGDPTYLDAGANFYRTWGHPNVRRVATLKEVVDDLDSSHGPIDKFRLVSHGLGTALEIGLIPEFTQPNSLPEVTANETEFTTAERFRKELAGGPKIISDAEFDTLMKILQKDAQSKPPLDTIGAGSNVPEAYSALGILIRAMLETFYLNTVQLDTGGAPTIKNRGVLDGYNQSRVSTYRTAAINEADAAKKKAVTQAIGSLATEIPAALQRSGRTFTITQGGADSLADPFLDPNAQSAQLRPELRAEIREGGGRGPFLKRLQSVRKKITSATDIEVRGCNIGTSPDFMDSLRAFFGDAATLPAMSAPDLFQYYFQLNFETFTQDPRDEAKLLQEFQDKNTGLASGYLESGLVQAKKVAIVVNETTIAEVSERYSVPESTLVQLNSKVNPASLTPGAMLWLVPPASKVVPAGPYTTLADVCEKNLGNQYIWPAVWGLNPKILNPNQLKPGDPITIPEPSPAFTELLGNLRSGKAEAVVRKDTNKPVVYLDDAKRAQALGAWLAQQKWDPRGRTAAALSRLFTRDFQGAARRTFIEFLSPGYPNIVDPIFPDDPRYGSHIIRRP